jgi:ATP/maltotriose-dependent transcriptional regulator MalT
VYAKLGVADRLAAVQRAQLLGLLPAPLAVPT